MADDLFEVSTSEISASPASPGAVSGDGTAQGPASSCAVPIAETPMPYVPVAALEAFLAARCEQIHKWGHTAEADAAKPPRYFAIEIDNAARAIREDTQFGKSSAQMRRHLIKLGALTMAMFDRLAAEDTATGTADAAGEQW